MSFKTFAFLGKEILAVKKCPVKMASQSCEESILVS